MDATQPGIWLLRTVSRRFRKNVLLHLCSFRIGLVVQDVPQDAFQHLADCAMPYRGGSMFIR